MNVANDFWAELSLAEEAVEVYGEQLGELRSQYASEVALYGDAGAGQGSAIFDLAEELAATERYLESLYSQLAAA